MSWQTYVDTNLVGTGKVSQAAIIGNSKDAAVWAKSPGFELSEAERKAIVAAFANPDEARAKGVTLNKTKYFTLQCDERSLYGKKAADGCVLVKTKQAVLVTVYKTPIQAPETTPIVEALADYLISVGY